MPPPSNSSSPPSVESGPPLGAGRFRLPQIQLVAKLVLGDPILLRVLRPPHPVVKLVTGDAILLRVERGVTVSTAAPTARAPQKATLGAALITWLVPSSR